MHLCHGAVRDARVRAVLVPDNQVLGRQGVVPSNCRSECKGVCGYLGGTLGILSFLPFVLHRYLCINTLRALHLRPGYIAIKN